MGVLFFGGRFIMEVKRLKSMQFKVELQISNKINRLANENLYQNRG